MREVTRPAPTRDLDSPEEIAEMVRRFYADVTQDDVLGPMFNDVAQVDWSEHLPKLAAFWCRALLDQPGYTGNPFRATLSCTRSKRSRPHISSGGSRCSTKRSISAGRALMPIMPRSSPTTLRGSTERT